MNAKEVLDNKSFEEVLKETCISIKANQIAISHVLKNQIDKLEVLELLIKNNMSICAYKDSGKVVREINNTIKSLLSYEYLIENKIDTVSRIYEDLK